MPTPQPLDEQLLSNMIQCLDRLYDQECGVEDVRALLVATAAALPASSLSTAMTDAGDRLEEILVSGEDLVNQNRSALAATDAVRRMVALAL